LNDEGYVEGRTVTIEFRFAGFQPNRLLVLAAEHVGRRVAVIAATGDTVTALSAKAATATTDQSRPRTEPQPAGGNLHWHKSVRIAVPFVCCSLPKPFSTRKRGRQPLQVFRKSLLEIQLPQSRRPRLRAPRDRIQATCSSTDPPPGLRIGAAHSLDLR
jgi:hypothetical protein